MTYDTGFRGRVRGGRRKRIALVVIAAFLCALCVALAIGLTSGFEWMWRFLTVPSLEAKSGRKFTPAGAVRRYIEKLDEKSEGSE